MSLTVVSTPGAPKAIGPYSQAIVHGGLVYTAGQVALDPATMELVPGGVAEQADRALTNLTAVLAEAGAGDAYSGADDDRTPAQPRRSAVPGVRRSSTAAARRSRR